MSRLPQIAKLLPQVTSFLNSFEEEKSKSDVVHDAICNYCEQMIRGARYKCTTCVNYDLCDQCEKKGSHDESHILMKINTPAQTSSNHRFSPYSRSYTNHRRLTDNVIFHN